ncbi:MAG TPA: HD domain-containing protein [Gemmatimonadales bacterium]|nr:HD domain-containing protein [Gemmatimonadales bacterium]
MSTSSADVRAALPRWAVVAERRLAHVARVVDLLDAWARARGVGDAEAGRWRRAALLHDALRDADEAVLQRHAPRPVWPLKTWHGPAAAAAAAADGERDAGVLDAVRYHSLGYARWDDAGKMLYLADYLEPGRPYERQRLDALSARVPAEPGAVLREVTALRIGWRLKEGGPIAKETWEFWNALAAAGSSSSR